MNTKLTLGFSPCPNDTFIFEALVNHEIDTEGLDFEYVMADVEELNEKALKGELDISKVSYHAFLYLTGQYNLLDSGGALGYGTGPLLISRKKLKMEDIEGKRIAIPGKYTTANFLVSSALDFYFEKVEMVFSEIETAVLSKTVDAGVIIHENRFTYEEKGLIKLLDLGDHWERKTGFPIPLGGIVVKKSIPPEIAIKLERVLKKSVEFAMQRNTISEFIRCNAQELEEDVMRKHIQLYVNHFSITLGDKGRAAVDMLFDKALERGLIQEKPSNYFAVIRG